jgi:hypothetical protein
MEGTGKFVFVDNGGEPVPNAKVSLPTVRQHVMHDFFRRQGDTNNSQEQLAEITQGTSPPTVSTNINYNEDKSGEHRVRPKFAKVDFSLYNGISEGQIYERPRIVGPNGRYYTRFEIERRRRRRDRERSKRGEHEDNDSEDRFAPRQPRMLEAPVDGQKSNADFGVPPSSTGDTTRRNEQPTSLLDCDHTTSWPDTKSKASSRMSADDLDELFNLALGIEVFQLGNSMHTSQRHELVRSIALETAKPTIYWNPNLLITFPFQISTDIWIHCAELLIEGGFQLSLESEQRSILMAILDCCDAPQVSYSTLWRPYSTIQIPHLVTRLLPYEEYIARVLRTSDLDTEGISKCSLVSERPKCALEWPYPFGHYSKAPRSPTHNTGVIIQEIDSDDEATQEYERPVSPSDSDHSISSSDTGSRTSSERDLNDLDDRFLDTEGSRLRSWLLIRSKSQSFFRHLQRQVACRQHNSSEPRDQSTNSSSKSTSSSSSSSSSTSSAPTTLSGSTSSGSKRRRDDAGEKDKQPGKKGCIPRDKDERTSTPRLACFYNKYDPMMYRANAQTGKKFEICETHDWQDMGKL